MQLLLKTSTQNLAIKLGTTGWARIHSRNAISWDERIRHDIWYVDHWSFWFDLSILLRTIPVVLTRQGLYGPGGLNDDVVSCRSPAPSCGPSSRPPAGIDL